MLIKRIVRSCWFFTSYIPETQWITFHFKTAFFRLIGLPLKISIVFSIPAHTVLHPQSRWPAFRIFVQLLHFPFCRLQKGILLAVENTSGKGARKSPGLAWWSFPQTKWPALPKVGKSASCQVWCLLKHLGLKVHLRTTIQNWHFLKYRPGNLEVTNLLLKFANGKAKIHLSQGYKRKKKANLSQAHTLRHAELWGY